MAASIGSKFFAAGTKIVAVGRNYAEHAKELGNAVPKVPMIFLKPTSSYVFQGEAIEIPPPLSSLHHEVELGVVIGKKGRDIFEEEAMDHISGYALALDMTARDIQSVAKVILTFHGKRIGILWKPYAPPADNIGYLTSWTNLAIREVPEIFIVLHDRSKGHPWTVAKGYDTFTPISPFISKEKVSALDDLELWLEVDGEVRQKGSTKDMIFSVPTLISYISSIMTLYEGDVILTGTPSGVGPVTAGQLVKCGITGLVEMSFPVQTRLARKR